MPPASAPRRPESSKEVVDRATAVRRAGVRQTRTHPGVFSTVNSNSKSRATCVIVAGPGNQPQNNNTTSNEKNHVQIGQDGKEPASESLQSRCAMGIPVPLGLPATVMHQQPETIDLAIMRSIQSDNYKFIRHMIIQGWTPVSPAACSFAVKINRPDQEQEVWQVREATPVHYAVCCGSLEAAAGLVVAFPELAFASCEVEAGGGADSMGRRSRWTALEFASFFGSLYVGVDSGRHGAYQEASLVLLHLKEHPRRLPFMQHHTPALRLAAAPKRPHHLLDHLRAAMS